MRADQRIYDVWLDMTLCIEVKSAPDKPWVLFSGEKESPLHPIASTVQRLMSPAARDWLRPVSRSNQVQSLPLLAIEDYPGHNLIRASLGPNQREDVAYKAILSAIKAAHWESTAGENPQENISAVAFPVVVIDSPLFKCTLDEDSGDLKLWRVESGTLIWRNSVARTNPGHTIVHVVTESALPDYAERASRTKDGLAGAHLKYQQNRRG